MVVADIAFPVVSLMAYAFTTVDPLLGWRYVFVLMAIIAGAVALARTSIPESPRYYLARGQKDLAEKALREIEGRTQRYCKKPLPEPDLSKKVSSLVQETRYRELFSRSYMRRTIAIGGMWAFYVFGFYGITAFLPLILVAKGFTIVRALLFSAVGYTGFIVGAALPSVIGERVQRGTAFNVFSLLAGACGIALALSTSDVQVIVLSFLTSMFALCTYIPMISYTPELFPTRMRASASGWGYGMGRLASIIAIYIIGVGLAGNTFAQIAFPAVSFVIAISFMVVAGIKTSGVTLEDISR
jgi:putative MFS transporter